MVRYLTLPCFCSVGGKLVLSGFQYFLWGIMKRTRVSICLSIFASLLSVLEAQTVTARLEGVVQDTSGALIPGAKLSAVDLKTQERREIFSTSQGAFSFPSLKPGTYTLTVEAKGFRNEIISSLDLNAAAVVNQIIKLEVGMSTETISITARDEVVQTTDSQRGTSITMRDIDTLPQLGRTPITLAK